MTLPRLNAMARYWRDHPPMHVLLAAHVGFKPASRPKKATRRGLMEIMSKLRGG